MEAIKHDQDKLPFDLLPVAALSVVAAVLATGRKKYGAQNWRSGSGFKWSRLIGAALRHIFAFLGGQDRDEETGYSHLAHAACCILFLLEHQTVGLGEDDRFRYPAKQFQNPPLQQDTVIHEIKTENFRAGPTLENDPGVDMWRHAGMGPIFGR